MTSAKKLVLVPLAEWEKIKRAVPIPVKDDHKVVSLPKTSQVGSGEGQQEEEKKGVVPPPTPSPTPSPTPGEERGKGEERGGVKPLSRDVYIPRRETGKDQTPSEIVRDAGIWRPPGLPISAPGLARKWIYV